MNDTLGGVLSHLGLKPREFLTGWIEGRLRYQRAPDKNIIPASVIPAGSIGFAASQAAVAFHHALEEPGP